MKWYMEVLRKYAVFEGRASRSEYWMFALINFAILVVLFVAEAAVLGGPGVLALLYALAVLLPSLAVSVRRLHDTDKSGWWLLLSFIPFASIVLLIFYVMDSTPGSNRYGPNPKEMPAAALGGAAAS